jgi:hypothetical protein
MATIDLLAIVLPVVLPIILDALLPPRRRGGQRATSSKAKAPRKSMSRKSAAR